MKVLILGNYHEGPNGWAIQLTNHILALDLAGIQVIPRRVNVTGQINHDIHPRILELEKQDCKNPDIIIQNVLPSMLEKTGLSKCVSYFVCETSNFRSTNWASRLNLMDHVLVPCYSNKQSCLGSGVTKPITIVPECVDTSRYVRDYPEHPLRKQLKDKFIFLCVAEWTQRKNIDAILRAFHTEFSPSEPVELVIKTTPVGMQNPQQDINNRLEAIKKGLKLYNDTGRYKRENVICGFLSEQDLASLYKSCDAYVNASRAEAFSIPTMDALGFGVPVVSPCHTGLDYLNDKNAFVVDYHYDNCFDALDALPDLYSARERWWNTSVASLCEQMRNVYSKQSLAKKKVQAGREKVKQYSIEVVGQKYKEVLERIANA